MAPVAERRDGTIVGQSDPAYKWRADTCAAARSDGRRLEETVTRGELHAGLAAWRNRVPWAVNDGVTSRARVCS